MTTTLRPFRIEDGPSLLALFKDTIRRVTIRDYSPEQIRAWASDEIDPVAWTNRFSGRFAVVAECNQQLAGFAELEPNGHIDRFYVSADYQRHGVGRLMMGAIIDEAERLAMPRLFLEASITARPFFESKGFSVVAPQTVMCRGVDFLNYRMEQIGGADVTPAFPA